MHICTVIKEKVPSLCTERSKHVFERELNDDIDGANLISFEIDPDRRKSNNKACDHQVLPYSVQVY